MNDYLGWMAAGLTLMTFASADPRRLRILALSANLAFMAYGATAGLLPVLALHAALLPINLWRLLQAVRSHDRHGRTTLAQGKCRQGSICGVERTTVQGKAPPSAARFRPSAHGPYAVSAPVHGAEGGAASAGAPAPDHVQGLVPLRGP